jgi:hypothetical protein
VGRLRRMADTALQYFPASESALYPGNSVQGQLKLSKAAWFREYEGHRNKPVGRPLTALSLDLRLMAI